MQKQNHFYHYVVYIINLVSANTGCIGFRMPNHPIALKLVELSDCPIAAPSANKFNHISPTSADHVINDLGDSCLYVIDGGETYLI